MDSVLGFVAKMLDLTSPPVKHFLAASVVYPALLRLGEVEEFYQVSWKPKATDFPGDHAKMNSFIDPAVSLFKEIDEDEQEEFR